MKNRITAYFYSLDNICTSPLNNLKYFFSRVHLFREYVDEI